MASAVLRPIVATLIIYLSTLLMPAVGIAQQPNLVSSPVLTVEIERLFRDSQFGVQVFGRFNAASAELAAENRKIEADLEMEERSLTEQRASADPVDFRRLADIFDAKVQAVRREQELKRLELNQQLEQGRGMLLDAAAPILEGLMREFGAVAILARSNIVLSADAIDITNIAIARINDVVADGNDLNPNTDQEK
ncbi:MAG: OmpH family outer membrane protein [Aestuariivita sp.]|nr:OmpH family outer membrane protein [Aestuariivita sp.]MCY4201149.1 OmpH family outer membrane protein [Aestuariivita sp.]MCY4287814.1 OmpH family outer membrane protein [Aestuariivita sp.]MCY4345980.1 OmpH family outer membrane protein [Aestuariivita sp.]